jgi:very-short-patch-repair endonuclease
MPHNLIPARQRNNAKSMRKTPTDAELKLWNAVRAHRLLSVGFRRQMPIDLYIVDFACPQHRIIVEVDGSQHNDPDAQRYDMERTGLLENSGWTVLRFTNDDVLKDIEGVCQHIIITATQRGLQ